MKMKKLFASLVAGALLCFGCVGLAFAQTFAVDWSVTYVTADADYVSDYDQAAVNAALSSMQPGDAVVFDVTIVNEGDEATDWYMTNSVLKTLEDEDLEYGGAYTYSLSYGDRVLYSSDMIGGEGEDGNSGLLEATEATSDWLYLATLAAGETGNVKLEVALDGSTQGNAYMNKLGTLEIRFAAEPEGVTPPPANPPQEITDNPNPLDGWVPKMGDFVMGGFTLIAIAAGVWFFAMGLRRMRTSSKGSR